MSASICLVDKHTTLKKKNQKGGKNKHVICAYSFIHAFVSREGNGDPLLLGTNYQLLTGIKAYSLITTQLNI